MIRLGAGMLIAVLTRIRHLWRETLRKWELASLNRAGRFARNRLWEDQLSYLRRSWWLLSLIAFGLPLVAAPLAFVVSGPLRWAIMGASVATGFWLAVLYLVVHAGVAGTLMGVVAEEDTVGQLRSLGGRGWRIVNGLKLREGDIDHVAVGPPGVVVVETKWSQDAWPIGIVGQDKFMHDRLGRAVEQARRNANDVAAHITFRREIAGAPVCAVVALWSSAPVPDASPEWVEYDDVAVVRGRSLGRWLARLEGEALDADRVKRVWMALSRQVEIRDVRDVAAHGPPRPTLARLLSHVVIEMPLGAIAASYVVLGLIRLGAPWFGLLLGGVVALLVSRPVEGPRK